MEKLSELKLEIQVLQQVRDSVKRNIIREDLGLTYRETARIFKKFKELWLTEIHWYWWSWEDYWDTYSFVWRHTIISDLWKDLLNRNNPTHLDYRKDMNISFVNLAGTRIHDSIGYKFNKTNLYL